MGCWKQYQVIPYQGQFACESLWDNSPLGLWDNTLRRLPLSIEIVAKMVSMKDWGSTLIFVWNFVHMFSRSNMTLVFWEPWFV